MDLRLSPATLTQNLSDALRRYARLQPIVQVRRLRVGLAQGCGVSIAGPNEILLGQPELAAKLVGIPFGNHSALLVEGCSGFGLLMLGGHGRQLVRDDSGGLGVGLDVRSLVTQSDLLLQVVSDGDVGIDEGVVKLLGLEMEVSRRGYHAEDHEGVPQEGIR